MNNNIEFIRGILQNVDTKCINLSEYVTEGDLEVWLDGAGEVNRTWTASMYEDVNLEDPCTYMDAEDDIELIMCAIQDEVAKWFNLKNKKK